MRYRYGKNNLLIIIILLVIIAIGVGYAYLTSNLSITGITEVGANNWDIHFNNLQVTNGSVTATTPATIDENDTTKINYEITLSRPKEYYEFTVDVVNAGSLDGMIRSINSTINNTPISNLPNYLEYSLTYADGVELAANHLLEAGNTVTYKLRITFKDDISSSDLIDSNATFSFLLDVTYVQADDNAINKPTSELYLLSNNGSESHIGDNKSVLGTTYIDYNDAVTNFGHNTFLRHKIENNLITESYVAYVLNNTLYYLKGVDTSSYSSNKEIMNGSVSAGYTCSETLDDPVFHNYYTCIRGDELIVATDYGLVAFTIDVEYECKVLTDGRASCYSLK